MPVCDDNVVGFVSGIHRLGPLVRHWTMRFEAIGTATSSVLLHNWEILSMYPTHLR